MRPSPFKSEECWGQTCHNRRRNLISQNEEDESERFQGEKPDVLTESG